MQRSLERKSEGAAAWYGVAAAFFAVLAGVGLCRFAFTPLFPAIVEAGWFSPSDAAYLGATNLAGYLVGALGGHALADRAGTARTLRAAMILAAMTFFASTAPVSFLWFSAWRFASGFAGGVLVVLAAPAALHAIALARRGRASGIIFAGVGLGIAASGTLVPLLLRIGLEETWLALGVLSMALTIAAWGGWPGEIDWEAQQPSESARKIAPEARHSLRMLNLVYGFNAIGLVPHMIFLVDYVARGLGEGIAAGSGYWVLFGLGAIVGPIVSGALADRFGFGPAMRGAFVVQALSVLLILFASVPGTLIVSSLVVGAATTGIVPLMLGRIGERLPSNARAAGRAWSRATAAFAIGQALAGYGYSFMFARSGGEYAPLFATAVAALVFALALDLAVVRRR